MPEVGIMPKSQKKDGFESWEIESAADTLVKAMTMKKKEPKLHKLAIAELKKRRSAINTIV